MRVASDLAAVAVVAGFAAVGVAGGLGYFAMLRESTARLVVGTGRLGAVVLTLGRLAAISALLAFAASRGAMPLLAAFLGFLVARTLALRTG